MLIRLIGEWREPEVAPDKRKGPVPCVTGHGGHGGHGSTLDPTWPGAHEIVRDADAHRLVELQVGTPSDGWWGFAIKIYSKSIQ